MSDKRQKYSELWLKMKPYDGTETDGRFIANHRLIYQAIYQGVKGTYLLWI